MNCFVYVIGTDAAHDPRSYVGWTTDLARRLEEHNTGTGAKSTRGRTWVLLYAERYDARDEAMAREWHLKRRSKSPAADSPLRLAEGGG